MLRSFVLFSCCVALSAGYHTGCGPNQVKRCEMPCPPEKTCRTRDVKFNCLESIEPCVDKCVCQEGYFRNAVGDCITSEQCDKCTGPNEYFACSGECDNVCSSLNEQNKTNCPIQNIVCNQKCYCEDGYARDDKGICIPIEKCSPTCNGNEVYTECKRTCPPESCFSLVARFKCDSKEVCKPGCACKPGYLRIDDDTPCVPICQCPEMKNSPDCPVKN